MDRNTGMIASAMSFEQSENAGVGAERAPLAVPAAPASPAAAGAAGPRVRLATVADAAGVLAVYAPYIEDTVITFETTVPSLPAFAVRMEDIIGDYPYLVVEEAGVILGYAYAHRIGERAAFAWNAEVSIYFAPACTGCGWGSVLLRALLDLLALQGVRTAYSLITVPNEASLRLHEKRGFTAMGTQTCAGFKHGAWHDVAWLHKPLGSFEGTPAPVTPFAQLETVAVAEILAQAQAALG